MIVDLEALTGSPMLSHSSLTTWLDCGEKYRLTKIEKAVEKPAYYLIGGSAFHTATELLDRDPSLEGDEDALWGAAWLDQYKADVTDKGWTEADIKAGGRASKEWPNKEDAAWWAANGPDMVRAYITWRDQRFNEGWQWLLAPNGEPIIEAPIQLDFGPVQVRGYVDRAMVNPDGEAVVVDLKTGSHTPASTLQLGIYALGIERHFGVRPILGGYYMARKADMYEPMSLLHYTPELVTDWFAKAKQGIEAGIFIPHVTSMCGSCGVRQHCPAFPGSVPVTPTLR